MYTVFGRYREDNACILLFLSWCWCHFFAKEKILLNYHPARRHVCHLGPGVRVYVVDVGWGGKVEVAYAAANDDDRAVVQSRWGFDTAWPLRDFYQRRRRKVNMCFSSCGFLSEEDDIPRKSSSKIRNIAPDFEDFPQNFSFPAFETKIADGPLCGFLFILFSR